MNGEPIGERTASRCAIRTAPRTSSAGSASTRRSRRGSGWRAASRASPGRASTPARPPPRRRVAVDRPQRQRRRLSRARSSVVPGSAAVPSQNFPRFGYGGDLRVGVNVPSLGATVLYGELYWAKNLDRGILPADPVAFGRDYREFGVLRRPHAGARAAREVGRPLRLLQPGRRLGEHRSMGATMPTALRLPDAVVRGGAARPVGPARSRSSTSTATTTAATWRATRPISRDNAFTIRGEVSF